MTSIARTVARTIAATVGATVAPTIACRRLRQSSAQLVDATVASCIHYRQPVGATVAPTGCGDDRPGYTRHYLISESLTESTMSDDMARRLDVLPLGKFTSFLRTNIYAEQCQPHNIYICVKCVYTLHCSP